MVEANELKLRIEEIYNRIEMASKSSGRSSKDVKLIAVSKTHPLELISMAVSTGLLPFLGENRVQEAEGKINAWPPQFPVSWHLIGHLQRNKARKAVTIFDMIHSVDNVKLAKTLSSLALELGRPDYPVLIEVNTSGEESKHGVAPSEVYSLVDYLCSECPALNLQGFMTVGPLTDDECRVARSFSSLREIRDSSSMKFGIKLPELSMGMSGDFELAIGEGSTMVRVGSAIFGERERRQSL